MSQPSFPLFKPVADRDRELIVMGVDDVLRNEIRRAALTGSDPDAVTRVRFSVDLTPHIEQHLQALAHALGSSRRAMGAKLLTGAVLDAINTLRHEATDPNADPEAAAVFDVYCDALDNIEAGKPA